MADPIELAHCRAFAVVDGPAYRPEIGETITIALRGGFIALEITATVAALEIGDDGESVILVDDTGCRWAMPVAAATTRRDAA